ncbi:beta-glucosidase [Arthrobacter sp. SLBN-100]|uniref:beta-glucosidase n=1 Tax=Arthrobacter sp. SLBN-100 TaxID=2768450 RepID=UPI0011501EC8|nr:glycoside hydrolase family 3 C-terminal domain-containing protein [Arthrobacter sp. SLBN-100]TQJ66230.1 beta-glucosidase [Arthrobacter sp. SLBN-100]
MSTQANPSEIRYGTATDAPLTVGSGSPPDTSVDESFQPWRDQSRSAVERAQSVLADLTEEQKIRVATGDLEVLEPYGIPTLWSSDGPAGITRPGTTVFPSGFSLASTFDTGLAYQVGSAIGGELRGKGLSVWLGPAADVARNPWSGRQVESFGEDPLLNGVLAYAEISGARQSHTIQCLKHYVGNNQELGRVGDRGEDGVRTPAIDARISERALQEIYIAPFRKATAAGGTGSVMGSYNRVNGLQACEHPAIIASLKDGWNGVYIPDYSQAVRDQVAAANAGVDLPQFDQGNGGRSPEMYLDGSVSAERLDDTVFRTLWMIFDSGLVEHPVGQAKDNVSTPQNRQLSARVAARGAVLLKNDGILPLRASSRLAVIGAAGPEAVYTIGGGGGATLGPDDLVSPLEALGRHASVIHAAGSEGILSKGNPIDVSMLRTPDGESGWWAEYWDGFQQPGNPLVARKEAGIALAGPPESLGPMFSARWSATLTVQESGLYTFTSLHAGFSKLTIDGATVLTGERDATKFVHGPELPVSGSVELIAGATVDIRFEYSSRPSLFGQAVALTWSTPADSGLAEAVAAAASAEAAIVFVNDVAGEGADRTSLSLSRRQEDLIRAVGAVNPRTVVVLNTGGAVLMPWLDSAAAVLQMWYPGPFFGQAVADLLFGEVAPAGRLPVSFPTASENCAAGAGGARTYPGVGNTVSYDEGILVGYRWHDATGIRPLFPFGFGLTYTEFSYTDLQVTPAVEGGAEVSFTVMNTGERTAAAVPQVYLTSPDQPAGVQFAPNALAGFASVTLEPAESRRVSVTVEGDCLDFYDETSGAWARAASGRRLWVGASSAEIVLGPVPLPHLNASTESRMA